MTLSIKKISTFMLAALLATTMFLLTTGASPLAGATNYENDDEEVRICKWDKEDGRWEYEKTKHPENYPGHFPYEGGKDLSDRQRDAWCNEQRTVTADPVVFVDPTCDELGTYTIPETVGVVYMIDSEVVVAGTYNAEDGDSVTVTAEPADMYFLDKESDTEWSHEFVNEEVCETPVEEEDDGEVLGDTTQVTTTPAGPVNAGGAGSTALVGLVVSSVLLGLGAVARKFSV